MIAVKFNSVIQWMTLESSKFGVTLTTTGLNQVQKNEYVQKRQNRATRKRNQNRGVRYQEKKNKNKNRYLFIYFLKEKKKEIYTAYLNFNWAMFN